MTMEKALPEGWVGCELNDAASIITKGTTPTTAGFQYTESGIPFIKVENINDGGIDHSSIVQFISSDAHTALKRSQFVEGDILFSIAGTIGKTALVKNTDLPANTNQAVAIIRNTQSAFVDRFLRYQLKLSADEIQKSKARGGAMNNISLGDLKGVIVPLPPLAEQQVIADTLDALLAQVETTKTRLERVPETIKRFRQSVLAAAVSGKLTEEWREINASNYPFNMEPLGNLIDEMRNGLSAKPNETGSGFPILRISSVRSFLVDQSDIRFLEVTDSEVSRYCLKKGDLLFTRYNGSLEFVGVCGLIENLEFNVLLYPDKLIRVRVDQKKILPKYLEIFSASFQAREYIESLIKSTSGQKGISGKDLKLLKVSLPSLEEQAQIVRRVEELFAHADAVEQQAKAALEKVNNLTQSILAKAFRGELTADWRAANPELISGENSAEALLARIKEERAAQKPKKRATTRRKKKAVSD